MNVFFFFLFCTIDFFSLCTLSSLSNHLFFDVFFFPYYDRKINFFVLDLKKFFKMDSEQLDEKTPIKDAEIAPAVEPVQYVEPLQSVEPIQPVESKPTLHQSVTQDFKQNKEINQARIIILILVTFEIVCKLNMKRK
jgi:hypothetical protein